MENKYFQITECDRDVYDINGKLIQKEGDLFMSISNSNGRFGDDSKWEQRNVYFPINEGKEKFLKTIKKLIIEVKFIC